ncbi:MAG: Uma2 family endonuclease [Acidobacteriaceae bacterium]|nr:Uma2 family endonuclease [Acidobacteriaceae bacterium]
MTVEQFEAQYGQEKPYFEYWFGEPVQKSMPTWLHSLLQKIIMKLLDEAGYVSGAEVKLKISDDFQPLPDVTAVLPGEVELPYPTRPVEIVVEVLSPDDQLSQVRRKCQYYLQLGIEHIYVIDPVQRELWTWSDKALPRTDALATIPASTIWHELDLNISRRRGLT